MREEWKKPKRDPRQQARDKRKKELGLSPTTRRYKQKFNSNANFATRPIKFDNNIVGKVFDDTFFKAILGIGGGFVGCWLLGLVFSLSLIGFGIWAIVQTMQHFGII